MEQLFKALNVLLKHRMQLMLISVFYFAVFPYVVIKRTPNTRLTAWNKLNKPTLALVICSLVVGPFNVIKSN